jgi:hypothetical protein
MFAQELFGLLQGRVLRQMLCSRGFATDGPDYNKLLCHMSFPEATFRLEQPYSRTGRRQRMNFVRFSLSLREVPATRAGSLTGKNDEARAAQEKAACEPILGRLCASGPLNSESSQRTET